MESIILVAGGGIAGMSVAVEAAELGQRVILVEKERYLGGRVIRMNQYFPKLCPPYCGMEINFRRLRDNQNVTVITGAQVENVTGTQGTYTVTIRRAPLRVNDNCTACGDCEPVCPVEGKNDFDYQLSSGKAIRLPHALAYPMKFAIDGSVCKGNECGQCVKVCKYDAIDLAAKETVEEMAVTSVVFATGWEPYNAGSIANLGYGTVTNVITNVEMERIAAPSGPTGGAINRPGSDQPAKSVVFVQCAGSRDENHLPYCSSVCCMASLKQARYVRAQYPDAQVTIFYIDLRAPGKYEAFLNAAEQDNGINLVKGKVAKVEAGENGRAVVTAEDILNGGKVTVEADLVVLATGMKPQTPSIAGIDIDPDRFVKSGHRGPGLFSVGVAARPVDVTTTVRDATAVAIATMKS